MRVKTSEVNLRKEIERVCKHLSPNTTLHSEPDLLTIHPKEIILLLIQAEEDLLLAMLLLKDHLLLNNLLASVV
jgi:hypothetical protein